MDPRSESLFLGLGPGWTIAIAIVLIAVLVAGTLWADHEDRRNPR